MGPSTGYDLGGKKRGCYDFTSYQGSSSIVCKNYGMVKRLVPLIYNSVFKKQINTFGET